MALVFGGTGVNPTLRGQPSIKWSVQAGEAEIIPAGSWFYVPGRYSKLQQFDPVTGIWWGIGNDGDAGRYINSDGNNWRVANTTGCCVAALITNAGSGYTSAPTVTASGGSAVFQAIVGGAINTSVTVQNGGASYTYPPQVLLSSPQNPGIQAVAYSTLTSGAVSSVTVLDQGAGYSSAPTITFINDPRDSTGYGASATTTLTGAGTITGLLVTNFGTPVTSVPTLSFAGGGGSSAAATAIMDFTVTAVTVGTAGVAYGTSQPFLIVSGGGIVAGTAAYTNGGTQKGTTRYRQAVFEGTSTSGGAVTATGLVTVDAGHFQAVPNLYVIAGGGSLPTTAAAVTATVGGTNDVFTLFAA